MLSIKENFLETLKRDGKPDRLVKQYEFGAFLPGDPIEYFVRGTYEMGMAPKKDVFGTELIWPDGYVAVMPHVTDENKVCPDVTEWKKYVHIPDIQKELADNKLWEGFMERVNAVDRSKQFLMPFMHTGCFERLHFLLGFEDLFVDLLTEPEAMHELCDAIADYRLAVFKTLIEHVHPDLILSHDDWGSKTSLFVNPTVWREFIKPMYEKIYGYVHDQGIIIVHHADSFQEPIIEDMVDLHIDVWQGVLPQNNIPKMLDQLDGRMTLMGGIDMAVVDRPDSSEQEIRECTRKVCEEYGLKGHFIPSITYGGPGTIYPEHDEIINDEIDKFNREHFGVC
jgi:hypothetical protein